PRSGFCRQLYAQRAGPSRPVGCERGPRQTCAPAPTQRRRVARPANQEIASVTDTTFAARARPPAHPHIVAIGGGIRGCAVAYHLARRGARGIVLAEEGRVRSGTTWHAAGLVGQLRNHESMTRLIRYSADLYARLEAETGLSTGWKQCGSLAVARSQDRLVQLRRTASVARAHGVQCEVISAARAGELYPLMRTDDLKGAVWLPGDGKANPADLTLALAKGARNAGVRICEGVRVDGVEHTTIDGRRRL